MKKNIKQHIENDIAKAIAAIRYDIESNILADENKTRVDAIAKLVTTYIALQVVQ